MPRPGTEKTASNGSTKSAATRSSTAGASPLPITRVLLYVKNIEKVARFYEEHFQCSRVRSDEQGWLELTTGNGCNIALHQAAKTQKSGAAIKIVFGVKDVAGFKADSALRGLKFGPIHRANNIEFANAKDPAGNAISISSRGVE